ncbi:MAG: hypothetical protein PW845_12920 [Pseudomonas sp.]|uniref:hypothetical protein n=1 Tax=Pseudomonas abieticivorans TaxID=2931382 RepID=UPI0020C092FD|nr:hypothetical protein [Pseudomonas sp. PIA16]MDE1166261.1 hypothetical protein [Pseudomonas sp.]
MSLTLTIFMLIGAWLLVAAAMLWGVLRISRRHQPRATTPRPVGADSSAKRPPRYIRKTAA